MKCYTFIDQFVSFSFHAQKPLSVGSHSIQFRIYMCFFNLLFVHSLSSLSKYNFIDLPVTFLFIYLFQYPRKWKRKTTWCAFTFEQNYDYIIDLCLGNVKARNAFFFLQMIIQYTLARSLGLVCFFFRASNVCVFLSTRNLEQLDFLQTLLFLCACICTISSLTCKFIYDFSLWSR